MSDYDNSNGNHAIKLHNMKTINQVYATNDYTMFRTLKGNRNVNKLHVRRLRESFKNTYLMSPIIVNEKYEIIDGQHRYEAAKELQKPINYIVCSDYGLKEVQILNTNMKNWGRLDYLNAYCDLGYPEYLKFRNFMRRFKDLPIKVCEALLTNRAGTSRSKNSKELSDINKRGSYYVRYFEEGCLEIIDHDLAVENAEKIMMIKPYYDGFNRAVFVYAMIGMFKHEDYNHSQFIKKLSANPTSLQHCSNVTQYKLLIEDIYNFRSREKVSLRF